MTKSGNKGVILEIRRERTAGTTFGRFPFVGYFPLEREGQQLTKPFFGCYFPSEGEYDMDNDCANDFLLYTTDKGSFKGTSKKIGKDLELSNGTSGYIYPFKQITVTWDEKQRLSLAYSCKRKSLDWWETYSEPRMD